MNRVREEFLQNLSHELRTPLTVMSSYANLTSLEIRKNAVDDDTLENLDMIKRESIRLAALVEQLKKVSLENDRQLTLTDTDIPALLLRAAKFCAPICRNGNRITVEAGSEPIIMRINADTIFQVLVNLITNANRHTKQDTIILKVEWKPDNADSAGICISVIDHGEGISPDQLPNITKRYTSGGGGEGLGLAICKEIIEEHGGMMKIESKQGRGTTVCFTLPCEKGKHT